MGINIITSRKMSLIKKLSWPQNTRMYLLEKVLDEKSLERLIDFFKDRSETERIIRLPKRQTVKKLVAYYFWQKIESGELSWSEVRQRMKKLMRKEALREFNITKKETFRLYKQRLNEIKNGK